MASTSGDYLREPGRICHYDNGVNGTCLPKDACLKEQEDLTGHNGTWKCPYHKSADRKNRYCCPNPGEENLLPGEENALSNSKKLCCFAFFVTTKNKFRVSLVRYVWLLLFFFFRLVTHYLLMIQELLGVGECNRPSR